MRSGKNLQIRKPNCGREQHVYYVCIYTVTAINSWRSKSDRLNEHQRMVAVRRVSEYFRIFIYPYKHCEFQSVDSNFTKLKMTVRQSWSFLVIIGESLVWYKYDWSSGKVNDTSCWSTTQYQYNFTYHWWLSRTTKYIQTLKICLSTETASFS